MTINSKTYKSKRTRIINVTKENMMKLSTYKEEFKVTIERYAEMRMQYDTLNDQWHESDCKITEEYTNKSGATNKRKTALYTSLETLRKELLELENIFGLTPKGLKAIKSNGLSTKKTSALDKALDGI